MTDISIIIPIHNGEKWIDDCMKSVAKQTVLGQLDIEIVIFDDGSNDLTLNALEYWKEYFLKNNVEFKIKGSKACRGVGCAKNCAIKESRGQYLCFQDVDDIMFPKRLELQYKAASNNRNAIIGSRVTRLPSESTPRLVRWANYLKPSLLKVQIFTSHGPTLLMPTWFCHRSVYDVIGGFSETGHGTPEDLIFFHSHLDRGGDLFRVDEELLIYRYHENATTLSVPRLNIWTIQISKLELLILSKWEKFTVWNAGRGGRKFVRSLSKGAQMKLEAFCDVDTNKIGKTIQLYCPILRSNIIAVPVVHYSKANPPLVICVKQDLTNGEFEKNLESLNLIEGKDYILFN